MQEATTQFGRRLARTHKRKKCNYCFRNISLFMFVRKIMWTYLTFSLNLCQKELSIIGPKNVVYVVVVNANRTTYQLKRPKRSKGEVAAIIHSLAGRLPSRDKSCFFFALTKQIFEVGLRWERGWGRGDISPLALSPCLWRAVNRPRTTV